jgi:hypothetical protein
MLVAAKSVGRMGIRSTATVSITSALAGIWYSSSSCSCLVFNPRMLQPPYGSPALLLQSCFESFEKCGPIPWFDKMHSNVNVVHGCRVWIWAE